VSTGLPGFGGAMTIGLPGAPGCMPGMFGTAGLPPCFLLLPAIGTPGTPGTVGTAGGTGAVSVGFTK
jgi:hypothetical protein